MSTFIDDLRSKARARKARINAKYLAAERIRKIAYRLADSVIGDPKTWHQLSPENGKYLENARSILELVARGLEIEAADIRREGAEDASH